jgi:hypothetical protein
MKYVSLSRMGIDMKLKTALLNLLFISFLSFAQPNIQWQKSLGGSDAETAWSIENTLDGGYIIAGHSRSHDGDVTGNHGGYDYWIVKLNQDGIIEWQKSLGGTDIDYAFTVQQTLDEGYVVAGSSASVNWDVTGNQGGFDCWVVKLDEVGEIEWQKTVGGSHQEAFYSVQQTFDGGYIMAGFSSSTDGDITGNYGGRDYWIVKLTSTGTIAWKKVLGGSSWETAISIEKTTDGGYIVGGKSSSNDGNVSGNHGGDDYWIVKLTASGIIEWEKSYGGSADDYARSVYQTTDGGYIVAGSSESNDGDVSGNHGEADFWVVKLSPEGTLEWQKYLGGTGTDVAYSIIQTLDGGYSVAGVSGSNDGDVTVNYGSFDYWVVKLDEVGEIEWQKSYGGSNWSYAFSHQQSVDGGHIVVGRSDSSDGDVTGNHGTWDYWIVKLSPVLGVDENELNNLVTLSPNPNTGRFSLDLPEEIEITSITIVDILGKTVYTETNIPRRTLEIDQNFAPGVYFVNVTSIASEATLKMIVE